MLIVALPPLKVLASVIVTFPSIELNAESALQNVSNAIDVVDYKAVQVAKAEGQVRQSDIWELLSPTQVP